jgi:hypothetical protein
MAALLTAEGFTPDDAFRRLTTARGIQVPDTLDQIRWVEQFAATHHVPEKSGGLNRSMQHWLAVYSPAFESPRSLAGVD